MIGKSIKKNQIKQLTKIKYKMAKKENHNADIKNPNKGTIGTNKTHDKNQGNRGKQLNKNQKGTK